MMKAVCFLLLVIAGVALGQDYCNQLGSATQESNANPGDYTLKCRMLGLQIQCNQQQQSSNNQIGQGIVDTARRAFREAGCSGAATNSLVSILMLLPVMLLFSRRG